ncbi:adenylate/guanylate cyclase domain-containing protein [Pseudanabaena sp. FACHB-2040]|uniref:adenylate/guanylate cyclase domain-containing protein n=1 Tax=Pseudanabaena sp. FACHB-2040 TaxID=2692859 RepID=UPI0016849127|nr:adenylate/guanylate cyclase domain-containing protein [Pseudanabaena sp. FACHB-2040]MBD2260090.1 adenylate/guanylate cyclase domain-containing protein [Pseudanabaena sp. FACHB-2040]
MENRVLSSNPRHRILAAIMMTDAVGFSARMSVDEESTLRLIDRDLKLIGELCEAFEGTLLKSTGDGLLVYFVSAVQAVSCALEIQQRLADLNQDQTGVPGLMHRIGIHLGDILVNESDVMGNGVNITARLQTYAKPGGLCISQTIHDVVKARLQLNAAFLGPLKLKNIQEPVPAYQVDPLPENEDAEGHTSLTDATHPIVVTPEATLATAIAGLQSNTHYPRIKKLIFAACQQAWENDTAVLDQFELKALLETLRQRYPTLAALKAQLNRIVAGLNRRAFYEAVAATVLMQIEPWYRQTMELTQMLGEVTALGLAPSAPQPYEAIAVTLETLSDALRVRKLLYCICHNIWENDRSILENYSLEQLVRQTHTVSPTAQDLKYQLSRIVKRLNRKAEYTRLANAIIEQFQRLYASEPELTQISAPVDREAVEVNSEVTSIEQFPAAVQDMTTLHTALSVPIISAGEVRPIPVMPVGLLDRRNLFGLRQEIMRYANPLRAKVLLHSCLHGPFSFSRQDWSALKSQTLDQLLQETFDYCPTFADLESKLTILSHCLDNAGENVAVAGAIARAMKAYYPPDPPCSGTNQPPAVGSQSEAVAPPSATLPPPPNQIQTALSLPRAG